jgi:hypothetical protein
MDPPMPMPKEEKHKSMHRKNKSHRDKPRNITISPPRTKYSKISFPKNKKINREKKTSNIPTRDLWWSTPIRNK